jgi:large subunit ribosomal protein L3
MNTHPGVVGRKIGMTQYFEEDGTVVPCTVIEARPVVVGKRTLERDGYDALLLGEGEQLEQRLNKPLAGQFKKAGVSPKANLRELRCDAETAAKFEVGQEVGLGDVFEPGQFVDVQGVSRGRGFSGVMRRYGFAGSGASHGAHEYMRHGGSIGQNMTPGRVFPGMKMPGQHGNTTRSVLNQRVVKVLADENLLFVRGGVPGPKGALVVIRGAVKKNGGKPKSSD